MDTQRDLGLYSFSIADTRGMVSASQRSPFGHRVNVRPSLAAPTWREDTPSIAAQPFLQPSHATQQGAHGGGAGVIRTAMAESRGSTTGKNTAIRQRGNSQTEESSSAKRICITLEASIPAVPSPTMTRYKGWVNKPFLGDWSAACWNAQGLLAAKGGRQHVKMRPAARLTLNRDFLVITETHGNEGNAGHETSHKDTGHTGPTARRAKQGLASG